MSSYAQVQPDRIWREPQNELCYVRGARSQIHESFGKLYLSAKEMSLILKLIQSQSPDLNLNNPKLNLGLNLNLNLNSDLNLNPNSDLNVVLSLFQSLSILLVMFVVRIEVGEGHDDEDCFFIK